MKLLAHLYFLFAITCCSAQTAYLLTTRTDNAGFFCVFNIVLGALEFCEQHNVMLAVDFQENGWYYDQQKGPNWWSYYFDQPRMALHGPVSNIKKFKEWQKFVFSIEGHHILSRKRAYELIQRYIRIKKPIQKLVDAFYHKHMECFYMIGIHYRGTDKITEAPSVTYEQVIDTLKNQLDMPTEKPIKLFIATDDQLFLDYMQKIYGSQICATNALRSTSTKAVHTNLALNNYKKGEDALIDCLLLSKCDFLMKMASNLSDVATKFNPDMPVLHLNRAYYE